MIECEFCGSMTDDPFEVEDMLICGHCILAVEMMEIFLHLGGTKDVLNMKPDGQLVMEIGATKELKDE